MLVRCSSPEPSTHALCLADFIITTSEFRFSVHTPILQRSWRRRCSSFSASLSNALIAHGLGLVQQVA